MGRHRSLGRILAVVAPMLAVAFAAAGEAPRDAFLGDWEGAWAEGAGPRRVVAQVIPRGHGTYRVNILPAFDERCRPHVAVEAKAEGGRVRFAERGWSGELRGDRFTGSRKTGEKQAAFAMKKVTRLSPRLGAKPPKGAIVLFDGTNFEGWEATRGGPKARIPWQLADGAMRAWPPLEKHTFGTAVRTRRAFADFQLHVEFRLPLLADVKGQNRANSGVIFEDYAFKELQILDSYGLEGRKDECGAIYNIAAPKVNMCAPPLQWQSYDVTYHGPRYDAEGKLVRRARMTVNHNGKLVHEDLELPGPRGGRIPQRVRGRRKVGRITLQHHGDPVEFRNIWLVELKPAGE